jgi:hypothetical protein
VCRLTTAILGASGTAERPFAARSTVPRPLPMQESYGRALRTQRRRSVGAAAEPEPDLEPADGSAAAQHGRRRNGRKLGALSLV